LNQVCIRHDALLVHALTCGGVVDGADGKVVTLQSGQRELVPEIAVVHGVTAAQGIGDVPLALEHVDAADAHQAEIADEFRADAARAHDRDGQALQWQSAVRFGCHLRLLSRRFLRSINELRPP
jgi:hypothetical protein